MTEAPQDDVVAAMQSALAAEHAVVYGYAVAGAHLTGPDLAAVRAADTTHRDRRDALAGAIRDRGATPVTAQPAYQLPFPVTGRPAALTLAASLEDGAAAAWRYLVAAADTAALRTTAVTALTDTAVRALSWRRLVIPTAAPAAFPGQQP